MEIRNSKHEARNKFNWGKSRNPKHEIRSNFEWGKNRNVSDFDIRVSGLGRPDPFRSLLLSNFGFLSDFEFRASNFGLDFEFRISDLILASLWRMG